MKNNLKHVGIGLLVGGVLGMAIDATVKHSLSGEFWIFLVAFGFGIVALLLSIYWNQTTTFWKNIKAKFLLIWKVLTRILESGKLLSLKDEQQKNPEKWLYPVIEYVDLDRHGIDSTKNDAFVCFQIDSHLLSQINEYYLYVKLCLIDPLKPKQAESKDWHEIKQEGFYPPIKSLERHSLCEYKLQFEEETVTGEDKDRMLLDMMQEFRNGGSIHAKLTIGVKFKKDEEGIKILGKNESTYCIAPIKDYRGW